MAGGGSVQDVNVTALQHLLLSQKQLLKGAPTSRPKQPLATVEIGSCEGPPAIATFNTTAAGGGKLLLLGA